MSTEQLLSAEPTKNYEEVISKEVLEQVPTTPACTSALSKAVEVLEPAILNHSLRVFLLASWLAQKEYSLYSDPAEVPALFVACVCHDFGTTNEYNGHQRFEIEGADAAVSLIREQSHNDGAGGPVDEQKVWTAIALHTSSGIAERIDPFTRLVRLGVKLDFSKATRDTFEGAEEYAREIEGWLPRFEIEKVLGDAVVRQAEKIPEGVDPRRDWPDLEKFPKASWPGMLLRAHCLNPEHEGVNLAF